MEKKKIEKYYQNIIFLLYTKLKFLNKEIIKIITNFAYISENISYKRKAINKNESFNYYKIRHFEKNCKYFNYKLLKKNSSNTR